MSIAFPSAPPAPDASAPSPEEKPKGGLDRRRLILLVAAAAVVLAGVFSWLMFFSGSDEPASTVTPPSRSTTATPTPTPSASPTKPASVVPINAGRNPFRALVTPTPAAPAGGVGTPVPGTSPVASAAPTVTVTSTAAPTGTKLLVMDVYHDNTGGRVLVDEAAHTVRPGSSFGGGFTVVKFTNGKCGTFRHGSSSFSLCEGQSKTV